MGRTGSSSKKKHSKKKSLKVSSETRRLKRSKRSKSKKLRRHDDSYPSFSDDDSTSSSPLSSSSSEVEYKSRKSRSHTRHELKGSKKRTRIRSCSEDSTNDSDSPPVKKRKRSKKKKKKMKKKKHRKDAYISSDSESCSTYGDEDSSSDKDKDTMMGKSGNRKNRRSRRKRSSSPYNDDDNKIENVMIENNPRRLKSVITVVTKPENEEDTKMDEFKEEMVYDYDYDYDNDSNDGETKKELVVDQSNIDNISSKEKESHDSTDNKLESGVDDLESVLRKKALENLSRFRGGIVDNNNNKQITVSQDSQPIIQKSRFTWRRDASVNNEKEEKTATYSGPESSRSQPNLQSATGISIENKITNDINEVKESSVGVETPLKEGSSNDKSQFEKKTMSVMRGGEMVQVSYKVYIPNRAPALARRQLKR